NVLPHFVQDLQVLDATLAAPHPVGDLLHPACAFTTGRTLPARLVREEPADVIQNIDDARRLVEDGHCGSPQAQTADLARAVEVQRRVEFLLGHQPHADPTGDAAFGLASFPDAPAVLIDQLPDRHAQRQLDAAGFVHVAADAVELGAVTS